jgi:hypothetical protein
MPTKCWKWYIIPNTQDCNLDDFYMSYMFPFNSAVWDFFPKNDCFTQLKMVINRVFLWHVYWVLKGIILPVTQVSSLDGFVTEVTCFSSIQ